MTLSTGLRRALFLSLVLFICTPRTGNTATYYVDCNHTSANDANPGTIDSPWLTIQHAATTAVAGDIVYIREGTYNEHVFLEQSGSPSAHIVFSAYAGETPILDGTDVAESQNGIIITQSYIKLIGLEIRNWDENGIWMEGAFFLEISDCEIHDVGGGIGMIEGTHDFVLNRVVLHHFDLYGFDATPYGTDCYNGTLNDCIAHTGRDPNQNVDGFALGHGTQHDITFNRCKAFNVYDGFDVGENAGHSEVNILLNRCTAYDCWNDGYKLTGGGTMVNCLGYNSSNANVAVYWASGPGTSTLHSCTFMGAETYNVWVENSADSLHMYNCILAGGDNIGLGFEQRDAGSYRGDYNLFQNNNPERAISVGYEDEFSVDQVQDGTWTVFSGQDAHSHIAQSTTELFENPASSDLHLLKDSPAIDNGTNTDAPVVDFDGNPRPYGQGYDIGAYEYQGPVGMFEDVNGSISPETLILSKNQPNPFSSGTEFRYTVANSGGPVHVTLTIYDVCGREIVRLVDESKQADMYSVLWSGRDAYGRRVPSGIYFYQIRSKQTFNTRKMMLVR